jgi:mannose-6-phosphate isomerase
MEMSPFKLAPVFKDYLWGGEKLKTLFDKPAESPSVAESWELAAHPDGDCTIAGGPYEGMKLSAFFRDFPVAFGKNVAGKKEFPVLIKLIDARESLSVQVHPDDEYARRVEGGAGKTEMWYVLDREPGAFLYCGFNRGMTADEMRLRIRENTITEVLRRVPVDPGDVFFIPSGMVHAIGAGILLAEIQQNSNTTYRVYDYDRCGPDGKRRPLHIEKAIEAALKSPGGTEPPGRGDPVLLRGTVLRRLASCSYFTVELVELSKGHEFSPDGSSFVSLLCIEGAASLADCRGRLDIARGESVFIPAVCGGFSLEGRATFLMTTVPAGNLS